MAKWGEGDPRWIVEERADATNVNNWHWTEKNATGWSKEKLKNLLESLTIEDDSYKCVIKELTKIEGEASANNRKAKLFFFYEWEITGSWKGWLKVGDDTAKTYTGTIEIPNLSEEHSPEEVDINVSVTGESEHSFALKEFLRVKGCQLIRNKLGQYITQLKSEFSQGMILPARDDLSDKDSTQPQQLPKMQNMKISSSSTPDVQCSQGVKIYCKTLTLTEEFKCSTNELYRALTDREMVRAFTRNMATLESVNGGRFSLFDGNVTGEFVDLVPDKKIEMRWRFKSWPDEHYSNVKMDFQQKTDGTELKLTQTGVPVSSYEQTRDGWLNYYWKSIKQTFGFGAFIY